MQSSRSKNEMRDIMSKVTVKIPNTKPRNPLVVPALMRKSGAHQKNNSRQLHRLEINKSLTAIAAD